jgi:hypothetical protein
MSTVFPTSPSNGDTYIPPQVKKLLASDAASGDQFGKSVALSADGLTAIVGAHQQDTSPNSNQGAAYVFTLSAGTWTQQQKLLASDLGNNDFFGDLVALSSDGNTALISATSESTSPTAGNGAAYVFTRSGSTWTQQAKLLASDRASNDFFGESVALSSDGDTAIVGVIVEDTSPNTNNGAAYIFTRTEGVWTQQQKLLASDAATNDYFGQSVALSADGNTAIVGAYLEDTTATDQGAAYVFTRSGGSWTQQQKLLASDAGIENYFGRSVALSSDGNTAIVGADWQSTSPNTANGAAYVFTRSGSTWTQQAKLLASDRGTYERFGKSVALSADGNTALIGAEQQSTSPASDNGAAYIFTRSGGTWTQKQKLLAPDRASSDFFGISVALSAYGNTVLIGAYGEDTSPNTTNGAAYVYNFNNTGTRYIYNSTDNRWEVATSTPKKAPTTHLFTSSVSWTIPTGAKAIHAVVIGGGGGGGGGCAVTANTASQGGAGGSGGALSQVTYNLIGGYTTTATITVGAGGSGGSGASSGGGAGEYGLSGNTSYINFASSGSLGAITASGGVGGLGGTQVSTNDSNTSATLGMINGSSGGGRAGGTGSIFRNEGSPSYGGAAGGGSGAGHTGTDTISRYGGNGGSVVPFSVAGGVDNTFTRIGSSSLVCGPGAGGAGGTSYTSSTFVYGGAGGLYGGGGGGGGSSGRTDGYSSGNGGAGAQGCVFLTVWYE